MNKNGWKGAAAVAALVLLAAAIAFAARRFGQASLPEEEQAPEDEALAEEVLGI